MPTEEERIKLETTANDIVKKSLLAAMKRMDDVDSFKRVVRAQLVDRLVVADPDALFSQLILGSDTTIDRLYAELVEEGEIEGELP